MNIANDQRLADVLSHLGEGQSNLRIANATTFETSLGTLQLDQIIERLSSPDQAGSNYTIQLMPDNGRTDIVEYLALVASEVGYFGYIMQYEPDDMLAFARNFMTDYDGIIRIYDLERTLKSEEYFEEGEQLSDEAGRIKTFTGCDCSYQTLSGPYTGNDISNRFSEIWILCICENDGGSGGGQVTYIPNEIGTIISSSGSFANNGSGSGGGGGSGSISTGNGEELGFDGEIVLDIINELTDPCLIEVVGKVLGEDINSKISEAIHEIFDDNEYSVNLVLLQNTSEPKFAFTEPDDSPTNNQIDITIHFNANLRQHFSQEYIAAVILHEAMHAYLNVIRVDLTELDQHYSIAENYIAWMSSALTSSFPDLSEREADALSFRLLGEVYGDDEVYFVELLETHGFSSVAEVTNATDAFRLGTDGTDCKN